MDYVEVFAIGVVFGVGITLFVRVFNSNVIKEIEKERMDEDDNPR